MNGNGYDTLPDRIGIAHQTGYIEIEILKMVMAEDHTYLDDEILLNLLKKYQCDRRVPKELTRCEIWNRLLDRWTTGAFDAVSVAGNNRSQLPAIKFLPHYQHSPNTGAFVKKEPSFFTDYAGTGIAYVNLTEFKDYLLRYVKIRLPDAIFGEKPSENIPDEPIKRDPKIEQAIWEKHIRPIVSKHNLKKLSGEHFEYQFFEKQINIGNLDAMVRKTSLICLSIRFPNAKIPADVTNDLFDGEINFSEAIVRRLRDSEKGPQKFRLKQGGRIDLRDTFRDFLDELFENETLPEFIEMLRQDGFTSGNNTNYESTNDLILKYGLAAEQLYRFICNRLAIEKKTIWLSIKPK